MYELALHFNPQCAEACNNLGVIYKDRDNLDKAVECYTVSLMARSQLRSPFCAVTSIEKTS
jgi:protein O-GlcNAc transferase